LKGVSIIPALNPIGLEERMDWRKKDWQTLVAYSKKLIFGVWKSSSPLSEVKFDFPSLSS